MLREARYDDNNDRQPERWEMFQNGRLAEIRRDSDFDGEPDQLETVPRESAGERETALTCDGSTPPPPAPDPELTAGGEDGEGESGETESTEPETNPGEGMPWEGVSDVDPNAGSGSGSESESSSSEETGSEDGGSQ